MDSAGARRVGKQLQLVGKSEKLETISRSDAAGVGPRAERGVCRCGWKYWIRDGGAGTDPEEGAWRNSSAGGHRRIRGDRLPTIRPVAPKFEFIEWIAPQRGHQGR